MLNIAHRGASGDFPENTLMAFAAAIDSGARMCELDAHLSADGVAVVIHDHTVNRTTGGRGAVAAMTLEQLRQLDAGRKFGAAFAGTRIPTLEEVIELTKGRCGLNIELKGADVESEVCRLVQVHGIIGDSIVSSFDWNALEGARKIEPALRTGVLADRDPAAMMEAARRLGAVSVNPRHDLVSPALIKQAHNEQLQVLVWTVDKPARMRAMIALGVDGIMTNYPARLTKLLAENGRR